MPTIFASSAPRSTLLIRLVVGAVFLSEGIQKFLFPQAFGIGRFVKIGIPAPETMAPFVGVVEIVCGTLVLIGLATRLAAIPLIIDIMVAIATTKLPMLRTQGFWPMVHEARVDWFMILGRSSYCSSAPGRGRSTTRAAVALCVLRRADRTDDRRRRRGHATTCARCSVRTDRARATRARATQSRKLAGATSSWSIPFLRSF